MTNFTTAAVASLVASIGIIIIALIIFSSPAPGSTYCMTKAEAQAEWPKQHLYWHTERRCWDVERHWSASRRALALGGSPQAKPAPMPPEKLDANANKVRLVEAPLRSDYPMIIRKDYCCWPDLNELNKYIDMRLQQIIKEHGK